MGGVMKKITLSFNVLAAIVAATILQACAHMAGPTQCMCKTPTLTPSSGSGPAGSTIRVTIATETLGAYLCYTLDGTTPTDGSSPHGTVIKAQSGTILVRIPTVFGRTLKAIAFKPECADSSIASGYYRPSN
jgi:hypothetical protein